MDSTKTLLWLCLAISLMLLVGGVAMALSNGFDARAGLRMGLLFGALPSGAVMAAFLAAVWFTCMGRYRAGRNLSRLGAVVAATVTYLFLSTSPFIAGCILVAGLFGWGVFHPLWESHVRTLIAYGRPEGLDPGTARLMKGMQSRRSS